MNTIINFTNICGNIITEQQLQMSGSYYKNYFTNGLLKKTENFVNNSLVYVRYNLDDGESIGNVISSYNSSIKISFFKVVSIQNNHNELSVKTYISGNLVSESTFVEKIDSDEEIIYDKTVNTSNGVIITYEKYYYENDELRYVFEYFDNGDVYMINSIDGNDTEVIHHQSDSFANFDWTGLDYYKKGIPVFP